MKNEASQPTTIPASVIEAACIAWHGDVEWKMLPEDVEAKKRVFEDFLVRGRSEDAPNTCRAVERDKMRSVLQAAKEAERAETP